MPIRIEIYAKDQITASSLVEFALSTGAVLHSYAEVDPPLADEPRKVSAKRAPETLPRPSARSDAPRAPRLDYDATIVDITNQKNPFSSRSKRWRMASIMLDYPNGTSLRALLDAVINGMNLSTPEYGSVRAAIRDLLDSKHLTIVS